MFAHTSHEVRRGAHSYTRMPSTSGCSVFRHHHPGFLHFVTKQPPDVPESRQVTRNQMADIHEEEDEKKNSMQQLHLLQGR